MKQLSFFLILTLALLSTSCRNSGDNFEGLWVSKDNKILITGAGNNNYILSIKHSDISLSHLDQEVPARYNSESSVLKFNFRNVEFEAVYQKTNSKERIVVTHLGSLYKK